MLDQVEVIMSHSFMDNRYLCEGLYWNEHGIQQ